VPYGTDSRLDAIQAINCLATIMASLRDKNAELLAALERVFDLQNSGAGLGVLFANAI
jgi:hypothetical protein